MESRGNRQWLVGGVLAFAVTALVQIVSGRGIALTLPLVVGCMVGAALSLLHARITGPRAEVPTANDGASPPWLSASASKRYEPAITVTFDGFDLMPAKLRPILASALEEAIRLNHPYVGTEHLLLGLLREGTTGQKLGVKLSRARRTVEEMVGRGESEGVSEIHLTPRAEQVLEKVTAEARAANDVSTNLLRNLLHLREGTAVKVLMRMRVDIDGIEERLLRELGTDPNG